MSEYIEFDFSPSKLPQNLRAAIGQVVAASAQTEGIINMAIAGCLDIDYERMIAVTQHMTLPLKISVLLSVSEIRIDDLDALDKLDELIEGVRDALEKRNNIVHDSWCVSKSDGALFRYKFSARTRVEAESTPIAIEEIVTIANTIEKAGTDLMAFLMLRSLLPEPPSGRPRGHKSRAARKLRRKKAGK
jgi:hypothetical protein